MLWFYEYYFVRTETESREVGFLQGTKEDPHRRSEKPWNLSRSPVSAATSARSVFLACCEILKFLELKSENSVDEFRVDSNSYKFRCLEELVIWRGCFLKNINSRLYFECLRSLEVEDCEFEAEFKIGVGVRSGHLNGVVVDH